MKKIIYHTAAILVIGIILASILLLVCSALISFANLEWTLAPSTPGGRFLLGVGWLFLMVKAVGFWFEGDE